ncbi:MAG: NUDIX hydrolase [Deltaproteobacteria bacterium]|nr:NUDIX hydrolase [Deltaproteobacteria bacterium]
MNHQQVFINSTPADLRKRQIHHCPRCGARLSEQRLKKHQRQICPACRYTHYLNPSPGVTVIVPSKERQVLIAKRAEEIDFGGKWCLPGGYVEYEESFIDAAFREVGEETGLAIRLAGIVNVVSNLCNGDHHTLVVVLLAEAVGAQPVAGDDCTEVKWIDQGQHQDIDYAFEADRRIIDGYFNGHLQMIPIDERFRIKPFPAKN